MTAPRILLSGDYWHVDFQSLISNLETPTTMIKIEHLRQAVGSDLEKFSLIVICQARQGQFDQSEIEPIVAKVPNTPVVMLLGSWCEGEQRSNQPVSGVNRVFWYQWEGRFQTFVQQLNQNKITNWHFVRTGTTSDRIQSAPVTIDHHAAQASAPRVCVGISAGNQTAFDTLSDAVKSFQWHPRWVERTHWVNIASVVTTICIDARSVDDQLKRRVDWIKRNAPGIPLVLLLNFPRHQEIDAVNQLGISEIVAKPFELNDLKTAIERSCRSNVITTRPDGDEENLAREHLRQPTFIKTSQKQRNKNS